MNHKLKVVLLVCLGIIIILTGAWALIGLFSNTFGPGNEFRADYAQDFSMGEPSFQGASSYKTNSYSSGYTSRNSGAGTEVALKDRKISYSGALSLFVKDAEESVRTITETAESMGGFVLSSRVYESSARTKAGNITLQVPAPKFRETMDSLKKNTVEVEEESIQKSDVTDQFIDLEKRIASLHKEEASVVKILEQANTVDEMLRVRSHLNSLQSQIESYQGQLQYVTGSTQMSTISAVLTADADVKVFGIRWKPLYTVKQSLRGLFSGLANYIDWLIWFVLSLPVIIAWGGSALLILFIIWKILLWIRARVFPSMPIS
jgi:hypothetical protein